MLLNLVCFTESLYQKLYAAVSAAQASTIHQSECFFLFFFAFLNHDLTWEKNLDFVSWHETTL